jgi:primosomal protein N' (replication factor Y)
VLFSFGIAKVDIFSLPPNFFAEFFYKNLKNLHFSRKFVSSQTMAMKTYISVILPLKLEWEPCYALKDDETLQAGERVKVEFARKVYTGVVSAVGIEPETELHKIKEILTVERGLERIREEEIALWRRVAEYYMCSVGEVYKAAYPQRKIDLEEARAAALQKAQERHERMLNAMREKVGRLKGKIEEKTKALENARPGTKKREQIEGMVDRLTNEFNIASAALAHAESAAHDGMRETISTETEPDMTLTPAQEEAYLQTCASLQAEKPVMLHGVTGSGKTEIYIRLAADALSKGRNVLYLVPEIALSRQLTERVGKHFGERLLTYHSGESEARRRAIAERIRTGGGTGYIVLGTRSSIFLPHNNLGLIIVDEEHDSSYKQDSPAPRYNGRDTALMLSVIHKCGIVLGSATPSLEEMYNCECGRHTLVTLNERYHGDSETEIEIIDTKAERRKRGMEGSFSRKLIEHIRKTLSEGGQIMVLRSRRAWASAMQCEECGEIQKCPYCNVSLSLHKTGDTGFLSCHYCGHREAYRTTCIKCNGAIRPLGSGTQKIEEEAAVLFPQARIARLDSDTAQNRNYETKVIKEFAEGNIDILIGTQILTKGFDFSNLRLTAVIAADTMLGIQDFRADEKALQLLEQFKGRCGRRGSKGTFIIQTSQPEHPIYQRIVNGETKTFSDSLLAERKMFGFPPYSRIVEITIRDGNQKRADLMASRLTATLRQVFKSPSGQGLLAASPVTGPYSPVVDRVQEEHIRCIRISMRKDRTLASNKAVLNETVLTFEKDQKYNGHITLNVDPA